MKEELIEKVGTKAVELLETMASKLGVTIEHLWSILVGQCYVEAANSAIACGVSVMLFIYGIVGIKYLLKVEESKEDMPEGKFACIIVGSIIAIIVGSIVFSCNVSDITQAVNPEYFAYQKILELLK